MVGIGMTEQHDVQATDAEGLQVGQDDPGAGVIAALARTGIIEQRMVTGTHQHGQALPHVQHGDPRQPLRGYRRRGKQPRQHQQRAKAAQRHPRGQ